VAVNGKLYGTTISGASGDYGTVYSVSTQGNVHVLHTFDGVDGASPTAGLLYVNGELYGTTMSGGAYRKGTVFRISTSGEEKVLFSFDGSNGGGPAAPLIALDGRLYGTTEDGGSAGLGTVFSMAIGGDQETVLHSFGNEKGDGYRPEAGLIARHGMLYGTTALGGTYNRDRCQGTCGTIFSITTGGKERIIHRFEHRYKNDGATPMANLIDVNGKLYGTTEDGGYSPKCGSYPCYDGTVFDVVP
jgi:uncharacterized repeat protein (TIGR03803 family)